MRDSDYVRLDENTRWCHDHTELLKYVQLLNRLRGIDYGFDELHTLKKEIGWISLV